MATAGQQYFHLELDHGFHFIDFGHHILFMGQQGRELARLFQAWAQDSKDLCVQRLKPKRHHVKFLRCLDVYMAEGGNHSLSLVTVLLAPQDTYRECGAESGLKPPEGFQEAFALLRVIVPQADLRLPSLQKLPALALVPMQAFSYSLIEGVEGVAKDFPVHGVF